MIYEFKSRATGSVVMTQPVAETLLNAIGHEPGAKGIITVEQIPAAIAAMRAFASVSPNTDADISGANADSDDPIEPTVSIAQRAYPLIDMLENALKADKPVTWGV